MSVPRTGMSVPRTGVAQGRAAHVDVDGDACPGGRGAVDRPLAGGRIGSVRRGTTRAREGSFVAEVGLHRSVLVVARDLVAPDVGDRGDALQEVVVVAAEPR